MAGLVRGKGELLLLPGGPFRLLPRQRLLLEGDKPVRLASRALDILMALVERAGELVGKDELMARVWPDTFVEEGNLKFQVGALRRTLGDGNRYLVNIPGRGSIVIKRCRGNRAASLLTVSARPMIPARVSRQIVHALYVGCL